MKHLSQMRGSTGLCHPGTSRPGRTVVRIGRALMAAGLFARQALAWAQGGLPPEAPIVPLPAVLVQGSWPHALMAVVATLLFGVIVVMVVYALRHTVLSLNRLFGTQRHPSLDIDIADWPQITLLIAAHNAEAVIAGCLGALINSNYRPPASRSCLTMPPPP